DLHRPIGRERPFDARAYQPAAVGVGVGAGDRCARHRIGDGEVVAADPPAAGLAIKQPGEQEDAMKHLAGLALSLGIALAPSMLLAQDAWPARPITFVVPYGAGGYTDLVGRLTARYVEKALGKPVIVDNRAGAGGIVGTQAVANAAVDGYMFCVCSIGAISIAPFDPNQKVGYDPLRDLAPVGIVSSISQVVIVNKDLPVKTLAEF